MKQELNIFWFRRDLRLEDNCALFYALSQNLPVLPVFIFDKNILKKLDDPFDKRVNFIHTTLKKINNQLNGFGSSLRIFYGTPLDAFLQLNSEFQLNSVFLNYDYEPYAISRDRDIANFCSKNSIAFCSYQDHVIFEKNDVVKNDGLPYTVFTPYSKKWKEKLSKTSIYDYTSTNFNTGFLQKNYPFPEIGEINFKVIDLAIPDPIIDSETIKNYHQNRDFPFLDKTSRLSVHLRFGTVSIRKMVLLGAKLNEQFLNELIWREFFIQILYHFPNVVNQEYSTKYRGIAWRHDEEDFDKWCKGETGFPLVDAGMRELNATGFMHNRVRMVVANFLTKILLIDWKWGEVYFASKLLDYELASNNGNWQWAAGCGCDAAPYFRIFNPETQIERFDPEYKYICKWIPDFLPERYITPIVDYKTARERALQFFKSALYQK
jgi:deoxyribodipyrimidine photo-lyase